MIKSEFDNIDSPENISKRAEITRDFDTWTKVHNTLLGLLPEDILDSRVFPSTIFYMTYWYHRFDTQIEKQNKQKEMLIEYFNNYKVNNWAQIVEALLNNMDFKGLCEDFCLNILPKRKTIDLFITKWEKIVNESGNLEFITYERKEYPKWNSLPWGLILESDWTNEYWFTVEIFAALRIGWEKVLNLKIEDTVYREDENYYIVENIEWTKWLKINKDHIVWYHFEESLSHVIEPSDPRHLVNTKALKMEFYWNLEMWNDLQFIKWVHIKDIWKDELVFKHHRELLWWIYAKTPAILKNERSHAEFISELIKNPEEVYKKLSQRFKDNNYSKDTLMPEFLPIVKQLEEELFSNRINNLCRENRALIWMRDNIFQNLQHLHQANRPVCPYLATVLEIIKAIEFFDIIVREELDFYNEQDDIEKPIVHNPAKRAHSKYHTYKYNYRFLDYYHNLIFKHEIMIPVFVNVWATDLMNIRGVPLRIVWLSTKLIYVDEFEQTPLEFTAHDLNHCRRYALEDLRVSEKMWISLEELYEISSIEVRDYMKNIIINKDDDPVVKEKKRLKKIILFEIVHEDARVFLKQTIIDTLLRIEWEDVPFELQSYNEQMKESSVVDIQEAYIHTLAYVKYKLQKGFYDTIDDQKSYIVWTNFRTSRKIAEAAYEMLEELWCNPPEWIPTDTKWNVDIDWIMKRVWSYWPPEIHDVEFDDPDKEQYHTNFTAATERKYNV